MVIVRVHSFGFWWTITLNAFGLVIELIPFLSAHHLDEVVFTLAEERFVFEIGQPYLLQIIQLVIQGMLALVDIDMTNDRAEFLSFEQADFVISFGPFSQIWRRHIRRLSHHICVNDVLHEFSCHANDSDHAYHRFS